MNIRLSGIELVNFLVSVVVLVAFTAWAITDIEAFMSLIVGGATFLAGGTIGRVIATLTL